MRLAMRSRIKNECRWRAERVSLDAQMRSSRRNVRRPGLNHVSVARFANCDGGESVEAFCKRRGKSGRHMLHDQDWDGKIAGKPRQDLLQGPGPASGSPHGDDLYTQRSVRTASRWGRLARFLGTGID